MNKKNLLTSIALSSILILMLHFTIGLYYEFYENFGNYLVNISANSAGVFNPCTNNDFVLIQFYMYLKKVFPSLEIFSIGKVFFLFISLTAIYYFILEQFSKQFFKILLIITTTFILVEHILIVNNGRIAFLLGIAALLLLFLNQKAKSRWLQFFYIFLGLLSILNRIEIAIIAFGIATIFFLLFKNKKMIYHSSLLLGLSIFSYVVLMSVNYTYFKYAHNFMSSERKLIHQKNFILESDELKRIINRENVEETSLKALGDVSFILDEPTLTHTDLDQYLKFPKLKEYIFKNPKFHDTYLRHIFQLVYLFKKYIHYTLLVLLLFIVSIYNRRSSKNEIIKTILFFLILVLVPFSISIILSISDRFLSTYLSCCILTLLLFSNYELKSIKEGSQFVFLNFVVIIFIIPHLSTTVSDYIKYKQKEEKLYTKIQKDYQSELKNNNQPFVLSILSMKVIPSKLFHKFGNNTDYNFLILGPFDESEFFKNRKEDIYGKDYTNLIQRINLVIASGGIIYGNEYMVNFIEQYLAKVHNEHFEFEIIDDYYNIQKNEMLKIYKYKITKR